MTEREALEMTLDVLERVSAVDDDCDILTHSLYVAVGEAIDFAKETLAQPEQEPVAWKTDDIELYVREDKFGFYNIPLYTHPPQRKPLTDEEIGNCIDEVNLTSEYGHHHFGWHKQFARAIEAAHGIKK